MATTDEDLNASAKAIDEICRQIESIDLAKSSDAGMLGFLRMLEAVNETMSSFLASQAPAMGPVAESDAKEFHTVAVLARSWHETRKASIAQRSCLSCGREVADHPFADCRLPQTAPI